MKSLLFIGFLSTLFPLSILAKDDERPVAERKPRKIAAHFEKLDDLETASEIGKFLEEIELPDVVTAPTDKETLEFLFVIVQLYYAVAPRQGLNEVKIRTDCDLIKFIALRIPEVRKLSREGGSQKVSWKHLSKISEAYLLDGKKIPNTSLKED